jgi:hypothetical protein
MKKRMSSLSIFLAILLLAATGYSDPWQEKPSQSETIDYVNDNLHKSNVYGVADFIPSADPDDRKRKGKYEYELVDWDVEMGESSFKVKARVEEQVERRNLVRAAYTLRMEFNPRYMSGAYQDKKNERIVVIRTEGRRIEYVTKKYEGTLKDKDWDFEEKKDGMTRYCRIMMRNRNDAKRLATALDYYAYKWGSYFKKDPFDD